MGCLSFIQNMLLGLILGYMRKHHLPLKIKVFTWLLLRRRLMTRYQRQHMVPDSPVECPLCAGAMEDCLHLFFACPLVQAVWQVATSEEAFWRSLSGRTFCHEAEWQNIFVTLWFLWTHKNEVIFRGCTPFVDVI